MDSNQEVTSLSQVPHSQWGSKGTEEAKTWDDRNIQLEQYSETLSLQKKKNGLVWWLAPVVPAAWEAEVGGSLEARNLRPQ